MKAGHKLVSAYFVLFYLIPLIAELVFAENIETIYTVVPLSIGVAWPLFAVFGLFLIMSAGPNVRIMPRLLANGFQQAAAWLGGAYRRNRLLIALIALPLSVQYVLSGSSGYRYFYAPISESASLLDLLVIVLNTVVTLDLFYCIFVRREQELRFLSRPYVENLMLSLVLVITANGTAGMVVGLISIAHSVSPSLLHHLLFLPERQPLSRKLRRTAITAALAAVVFSFSWLAGETIKRSSGDRDAGFLVASQAVWRAIKDSPEFLETYGYYVISALSSYYYSALFTADAPREVLNAGKASPLVRPLESLAFRLDYLTGGLLDIPRPEHGSLSRLNYTLLANIDDISDRQGTSPGLVASFNYILAFPFGLILCAVYLCWVGRLANWLLSAHHQQTLSWFGILLLLFYMLVFFQSPFDWLMVVDNAVIYVLLVIAIAFHSRSTIDVRHGKWAGAVRRSVPLSAPA